MAVVLGYLLATLVIVLFYGFVIFAIKISGAWKYIKKISMKESGIFCLFVILSCLFLMFVLNKNNFIYYWDCTMHWTPVITMSKDLFLDPKLTIENIYKTTGITDYNWTMPFLFVLPAKILGCEFGKVIMIAYGLYMVPALLVNAICIKAYVSKMGYLGRSIVTYAIALFTIPIVPNVILKGYMDGPVLLLSALVLLLFVEYRYDKVDWLRNVIIACSMVMLTIFRRHWAYWCVGLAILLLINFFTEKITAKQIKYFVINMLSIVIMVFAILFLFFRSFTERCMRNYYDIYQGWNRTWNIKLLKIEESIGNYIFIIIVLSIICVISKRIKIKKIIGALSLLIIPILVMSSVVLMHDSHFYFAVLPIGILLGIFYETFDFSKIKHLFICIYGMVNFLFCFINPSGTTVDVDGKYKYIVCDLKYVPYYREDCNQIRNLVGYLNYLAEEKNLTNYVCASSKNINYQMLNYAYAPESLDSLKNDLDVASSDMRDGFNTNFFDADVVVIEKNMDEEAIYQYNQVGGSIGVRGFLTDEIQNSKSNIGKHYMLSNEYYLNYQYKSVAQVYIKTSEFDTEDYEYMIAYYNELYPEHKEIFADRIYEYVRGKNIE